MSKVEVCVFVRAYAWRITVCSYYHSLLFAIAHSITLLWTAINTLKQYTIFFELQQIQLKQYTFFDENTIYTPEAKAVEVTTLDIREGSVLISLQHLRMYWGLKQLKIE